MIKEPLALKIFFGRFKRLEFGKARQFSTYPDDAGVVISPRSHPTLDRQREKKQERDPFTDLRRLQQF